MPELSKQANAMVLSYKGIRKAVGVSGLLLPVALGPGGWLLGIPFQDNISSYYHTGLRDVFVGTMCAIAVFLFCYRGHDWVESWTANLGCLSVADSRGMESLAERLQLSVLDGMDRGMVVCRRLVDQGPCDSVRDRH